MYSMAAESLVMHDRPGACCTHHLPLLGHLLDLPYKLLLLVLQAHSLPVQLSDGLVKHALVLPQQF